MQWRCMMDRYLPAAAGLSCIVQQLLCYFVKHVCIAGVARLLLGGVLCQGSRAVYLLQQRVLASDAP
jgi:hypothetical protein